MTISNQVREQLNRTVEDTVDCDSTVASAAVERLDRALGLVLDETERGEPGSPGHSSVHKAVLLRHIGTALGMELPDE